MRPAVLTDATRIPATGKPHNNLDFLVHGDVIEFQASSSGAIIRLEIHRTHPPQTCQMGSLYQAIEFLETDGGGRKYGEARAVKAIPWLNIKPGHADNPLLEVQVMQHLAAYPAAEGYQEDRDYVLHEVWALKDNHALYMVMPYCEADLLSVMMMRQPTRFTESEAHSIFGQMMKGMRFIQHAGIAHRDISLENIMIRRTGSGERITVLIDYGQALETPNGARDLEPQGHAGKVYAMAPEVFMQEHPFDPHAADMWSAGVCLYIMLFGHYPFGPSIDQSGLLHDISVLGKLKAYLEGYEAGGHVPVTSGDVKDVIQWCLRRETSERPRGLPTGPINGADALLQHRWLRDNS